MVALSFFFCPCKKNKTLNRKGRKGNPPGTLTEVFLCVPSFATFAFKRSPSLHIQLASFNFCPKTKQAHQFTCTETYARKNLPPVSTKIRPHSHPALNKTLRARGPRARAQPASAGITLAILSFKKTSESSAQALGRAPRFRQKFNVKVIKGG
jgi:hypothetical protein